MTNTQEKRILQGKFYKAANGHNSYEICYATEEILSEISIILISRFGCTQPDTPFIGLDSVITQCNKDDIQLDLGWDIWSGFYILANSREGDELVQEIGVYLNSIIGGKEFERYIHIW